MLSCKSPSSTINFTTLFLPAWDNNEVRPTAPFKVWMLTLISVAESLGIS